MEICPDYTRYKNTSFTSKCNPIKPTTIKTQLGKVRIYEPTDKEIFKQDFLLEVADVFVRNFSTFTNDPAWLIYSKPGNEVLYKEQIKHFRNYLLSSILKDDGHLSLLVARDKNKKLCGACISRGLDEIPGTFKNTMYIDSIAIDENFRKNGIGKIFMDKSINADKNHFTDIFLVGELFAKGFYEKLGFKTLNPKNSNQKKVIDYIAIDREDYPDYVSLFHKPLQLDKPRWYDVVAKDIDKTNETFSRLYKTQG